MSAAIDDHDLSPEATDAIEAAHGTSLVLEFEEERETKGTWRFAEVVPDDGVTEPKIGTIYVRKSTLGELGWTPGEPLHVTIAR